MKHTSTIAAFAIAAALSLAPLAGCSTNAQQDATKQDTATTQDATTEQKASTTKDASGEQKEYNTDYMVLVNKGNKLPDGWEKTVDLVEQPSALYDEPVRVEHKAYEAYKQLKDELAAEGVTIDLDSAYRSIEEQQEIVDSFTKKYGEEYVKKYVAVPGYSEHHTGLALDLYPIVDGEAVAANEDMVLRGDIWAKVHAKLADHGFILRYLYGKEAITGAAYEPWHIRYVGDPELAHKIMDEGITFEEYLGEDQQYEVPGVTDVDYEVDYGNTDAYTTGEITAALAEVMTTFNGWKGCTMQRIALADDATCNAALAEANSARGKNDPAYDQAIVFVSDFHSPNAEQAKDTAWEPDKDYKDYKWTLARTNNGGWRLLNWGYA